MRTAPADRARLHPSAGAVVRHLRALIPQTPAGWRSTATTSVFVLLSLYFGTHSGGTFVSSENLNLLLRQASVLAVVAVGTGVVIVMGEIDLSIGSAIYLTGLASAWAAVNWGMSLVAAIAVAIAIGLALGAWQGFWVAVVGMPSFIVTLAGLLAFRGIGETWSNAASIAPVSSAFTGLTESGVPTTLSWAMLAVLVVAAGALGSLRILRGVRSGRLVVRRLLLALVVFGATVGAWIWLTNSTFGLPTAALWICGVGGTLWFLMSRTVFGRDGYLIGANRQAAFRAGIAVRRKVFLAFLLTGAIYGIGGILLTARLDGSTSTAGINYELFAIAAAVLGGVSLRGGLGTIPGVAGGAILLTLIQNGMDLTSTSTFMQAIVEAAILLGAVALDTIARRQNLRIPYLGRLRRGKVVDAEHAEAGLGAP